MSSIPIRTCWSEWRKIYLQVFLFWHIKYFNASLKINADDELYGREVKNLKFLTFYWFMVVAFPFQAQLKSSERG